MPNCRNLGPLVCLLSNRQVKSVSTPNVAAVAKPKANSDLRHYNSDIAEASPCGTTPKDRLRSALLAFTSGCAGTVNAVERATAPTGLWPVWRHIIGACGYAQPIKLAAQRLRASRQRPASTGTRRAPHDRPGSAPIQHAARKRPELTGNSGHSARPSGPPWQTPDRSARPTRRLVDTG